MPNEACRFDDRHQRCAVAAPVVMGGGQRFDRSESLIVRIDAADGMTGGRGTAAKAMTGETLGCTVAR